MWMWQETLLQNFVKFGVNLTFLHLGYHGNDCHFEFLQPQKLPHTTVDIPTKFHEVWWKESKIILNPPFFGRIRIIRIIIMVKKKHRITIHHPTTVGVMQLELPLQSNSGNHLTPWLPIPKTTTIINSQDPRSTWKPNFAQIRGFLYFGGHFGWPP